MDFRLVFILLLLVILGLAAAVIVLRFFWVNFTTAKYDKIDQDDLSSVTVDSDAESTKKEPCPMSDVESLNNDPCLTSEKTKLLQEDQEADEKDEKDSSDEKESSDKSESPDNRTPSSNGTPPPPYEDGRTSPTPSPPYENGRTSPASSPASSIERNDENGNTRDRDISPSRDGILHLTSPMLFCSGDTERDPDAQHISPVVSEEKPANESEKDTDTDSESSETSVGETPHDHDKSNTSLGFSAVEDEREAGDNDNDVHPVSAETAENLDIVPGIVPESVSDESPGTDSLDDPHVEEKEKSNENEESKESEPWEAVPETRDVEAGDEGDNNEITNLANDTPDNEEHVISSDGEPNPDDASGFDTLPLERFNSPHQTEEVTETPQAEVELSRDPAIESDASEEFTTDSSLGSIDNDEVPPPYEDVIDGKRRRSRLRKRRSKGKAVVPDEADEKNLEGTDATLSLQNELVKDDNSIDEPDSSAKTATATTEGGQDDVSINETDSNETPTATATIGEDTISIDETDSNQATATATLHKTDSKETLTTTATIEGGEDTSLNKNESHQRVPRDVEPTVIVTPMAKTDAFSDSDG